LNGVEEPMVLNPTTNAPMRSDLVTIVDVILFIAANPMQVKPAAYL
jgi:pentose-5-phosphate-3-epimerase